LVQGGPTVRPGVDRETSYEITIKDHAGAGRPPVAGIIFFLKIMLIETQLFAFYYRQIVLN
jgi:hypothetical protein